MQSSDRSRLVKAVAGVMAAVICCWSLKVSVNASNPVPVAGKVAIRNQNSQKSDHYGQAAVECPRTAMSSEM